MVGYLSLDETISCVRELSGGYLEADAGERIFQNVDGMFLLLRQMVNLAMKHPSLVDDMPVAESVIFERSFRNVESEDPEAIYLLAFLAVIRGSSIPISEIAKLAQQIESLSGTRLANVLDKWFTLAGILNQHSLIQFTTTVRISLTCLWQSQ